MNCKPENSGCWYCATDFDSPLGWWSSCEFDCVLHAECIEYEINEVGYGDDETMIFMRELGYELND
jgi:hypothetical protein